MSYPITIAGAKPFSVTDALKPGALLLQWMVLVSFFSWERDPDLKLNGWWAAALQNRRHQFGSLLWRLTRAKLLPKTLIDAQTYLEQAIQWMVDQRVIDSFKIATSREGDDRLAADVSLFRGNERIDMTFSDLWRAVLAS